MKLDRRINERKIRLLNSECRYEGTIYRNWRTPEELYVSIWFWGAGFSGGLTGEEKEMLRGWNERWAAFVRGEDTGWGPVEARGMRRWRADGGTDVWEDDRYEAGPVIWELVTWRSQRAATPQKEPYSAVVSFFI